MDSTVKNILFYVVIFLLFCVFGTGSVFVAEKLNWSKDLVIVVFGLLFTALVYGMNSVRTTKDNFYFELTPEKHCEGGAYMHSSAPEAQKAFCSQFTPQQDREFTCPRGFHGRPVHWERTSMSDDEWQNKMCNKINYSDPQVL